MPRFCFLLLPVIYMIQYEDYDMRRHYLLLEKRDRRVRQGDSILPGSALRRAFNVRAGWPAPLSGLHGDCCCPSMPPEREHVTLN